jgi:hypothetical protein
MGPEGAFIIGSLSFAGEAEWLAWPAAAEDVDGLDGRPVDGGDVFQVRHSWPARGEDFACSRVDLAMSGDLATEDGFNGHVEATSTREE